MTLLITYNRWTLIRNINAIWQQPKRYQIFGCLVLAYDLDIYKTLTLLPRSFTYEKVLTNFLSYHTDHERCFW